jgi:hypothetical protein
LNHGMRPVSLRHVSDHDHVSIVQTLELN